MTILYNLLKSVFLIIGIWRSIVLIWQLYEKIRYKEIRPNPRDTWIALLLTLLLFQIFRK